MSPKFKDILDLSVAERILLVEDIWDSIVAESPEEASSLTESQRNEIERRLSLYRSGQTTTFTWKEVRQNIGKS